MSRAAMLREVRMESFERVYGFWCRKRITQAAAARVLGVTARTFRRWVVRYEAGGLSALRDQRAGFSGRRAPPEETAWPARAGRCRFRRSAIGATTCGPG